MIPLSSLACLIGKSCLLLLYRNLPKKEHSCPTSNHTEAYHTVAPNTIQVIQALIFSAPGFMDFITGKAGSAILMQRMRLLCSVKILFSRWCSQGLRVRQKIPLTIPHWIPIIPVCCLHTQGPLTGLPMSRNSQPRHVCFGGWTNDNHKPYTLNPKP